MKTSFDPKKLIFMSSLIFVAGVIYAWTDATYRFTKTDVSVNFNGQTTPMLQVPSGISLLAPPTFKTHYRQETGDFSGGLIIWSVPPGTFNSYRTTDVTIYLPPATTTVTNPRPLRSNPFPLTVNFSMGDNEKVIDHVREYKGEAVCFSTPTIVGANCSFYGKRQWGYIAEKTNPLFDKIDPMDISIKLK